LHDVVLGMLHDVVLGMTEFQNCKSLLLSRFFKK